ncbi:MAG TPA: peptidoglycan DD-metalloendopeptidase family protein, partial [Casimicrobiaceae bacterium]|nr:peptidoglycan DD-metalloendopeptidase family protein [Casimicrobiaceae bacterium]
DYRELAAWNNIADVNRIFAGQVLRLTSPDAAAASGSTSPAGVTTAPLRSGPPIVAAAPGAAPAPSAAPATPPEKTAPPPASRSSETYKTQPKAVKEPYSERALRELQQRMQAGSPAPVAASAPAAAPSSAATPPPSAAASAPEVAPTGSTASPPPNVIARAEPRLETRPAPSTPPAASGEDDDKLDWVWPATGKLVTGFSDTANLKGIDIAGKAGQPVLASAPGKVVYAGTGLRGYGKLIIIKHNNNYLSAYAHNKEILVKEGQQVQRGQKIAEMGSTDADQVKLHFEIRRLGKPMDPLKYLPPA